MAFNRNHVRAFLAKTEIDLFESSLGDELKALTAADVHRRIDRTRKLRTKYRDLLQRQKLATRARTSSKVGTSGEANERTEKKAKAFDETLARFEAHAAHLENAAEKAPVKSKKPAVAKATPAKAAPAKATPEKKVAQKKAAAKKRPAKSKLIPAAVMLREVMDSKNGEKAAAVDYLDHAHASPASSAHSVSDLGATPPNVRAAVVTSRLNQAGMKRIQGHSGTQVRMAQAKKDNRGKV